MPPANLAEWTVEDYDRAAQEYCASLPLEHFMEATPQSAQRAITLASLKLIESRRRDFQVFNELLVQYPINDHLGQVVPDNMVVLSKEAIQATGSYNLPFEPAAPFWVLEYVSPASRRKDYEDNFQKYQHELKVPYYLLFYPEMQDLRLYRHTGGTYESVEPNAQGRLNIREVKVEIALLDGWARFWHRGVLVPLPDELERELNEVRDQLDEARERIVNAQRQARRQKQRAEQEKQRAEAAEEQAQRERRRSRQEREKLAAAEAEVERLKAQIERLQRR